jgi:hypothetical protein
MPYKDKAAQLRYQAEWAKRNRQEWVTTNGPCVKCGSMEYLQVDHIDPSQKVSHRIWTWSKERRAAELAKCQVLCLVCHKAKTRAQIAVAHGTRGKYNGGCRCEECRKANKTYQRLRKNPYKFSPNFSMFPGNIYYELKQL